MSKFCSECGTPCSQGCSCEQRSRSRSRKENGDEPPPWAKAQQSELLLALQQNLAPIKKDVEVCKERLKNVEGQQGLFDERISALEKDSAKVWRASALWIKNFCTFDERRSKGVSRVEMEKILDLLKDGLPPELRPHVGEMELTGATNTKVKVHIKAGFVHEIAGIWNGLLESQADLSYHQRVLFCHAERSPSEQQVYNTAGAVMAWLRSVTNDVEVSCTWKPDFFLLATPLMATDSIRVGFVSQDAVTTWDVQGLEQVCSGMTPEKANIAVTVFRSRKRK